MACIILLCKKKGSQLKTWRDRDASLLSVAARVYSKVLIDRGVCGPKIEKKSKRNVVSEIKEYV